MQLLPTVGPDTALFLDFDGTLADIAPTPDAVQVSSGLVVVLAALQRQLRGALAIVSGRPIAELDHFLAPLQLPTAGEHGAHCRFADGSTPSAAPPPLAAVQQIMDHLHRLYPQLLVERKPHSIALHYRHAPGLESVCMEALAPIVAARPQLELLRGKMVLEVKQAGVHKGQAIAAFMLQPPFAGRTPLFAGDDTTDEHGFVAVQQLGGHGIKVGEGPTLAHHRCLGPAALRGWLAAARTQLDAMEGSTSARNVPAGAGQGASR